ncbi:uncharacterized protein LOC124450403 isoform X1 [Xenia sp. Carnegie-2017]|nr:uncharacterized protein LOC124450403 isoform X1 [Xenia sp. Carnegie-2017]
MFTNEQLLDRIYDPDHTLCRNFGAEIYVPKHAHDGKTCTAIRSEASGNCLYSSASLVLVYLFVGIVMIPSITLLLVVIHLEGLVISLKHSIMELGEGIKF